MRIPLFSPRAVAAIALLTSGCHHATPLVAIRPEGTPVTARVQRLDAGARRIGLAVSAVVRNTTRETLSIETSCGAGLWMEFQDGRAWRSPFAGMDVVACVAMAAFVTLAPGDSARLERTFTASLGPSMESPRWIGTPEASYRLHTRASACLRHSQRACWRELESEPFTLRFVESAVAGASHPAETPPASGAARGEASLLPDSLSRRIDALFARFDTTTPGCLVGVARNGVPIVRRGYGMANLEYRVPLTAGSISESGSVAKQFTAAAVALLQLEGKLSLDDDVRRYIPELPDFGHVITIRHLLTMTSGLRDQWALLGLMGRGPGTQVHTNAQIVDLVSRQRELNFVPGSEYLYSNTGYVLAATIVARVSGMPFAQFERERLFAPLGMRHTQWRDDYRRVVPGRATAYAFERGTWVQDMPFTMVHGNGGLLSTLDDLLAWNEALSTGLLGRPELTQLLETRMRLTDGRLLTYALGLQVNPWSDGVREVSHSGSTAGYRTFLSRYPEARTSVAVWCNAASANAVQLGRALAELFVPRATPARVPATALPEAELARIAGRYRSPRTDDELAIERVGDFARIMAPSNDTLSGTGTPGTYRTTAGVTLAFSPVNRQATALRVVSPDGEVTELVASSPPNAASWTLGDYAGTYRAPELDTRLVIRRGEGRLLARISPDEEYALVPSYPDGFRMGPASLRFVRDAKGRVTGLRAFAGRARYVRYDRER